VDTPQRRLRRSRSDLVHLRSLASTQPASKTGQVIWAWAEIEACLASGMKLKAGKLRAKIGSMCPTRNSGCTSLGFDVVVDAPLSSQQQPAAETNGNGCPPAPVPSDPFLNLRLERAKKERSGFEYDPFSINKNLI
jgi:hypothetical protein